MPQELTKDEMRSQVKMLFDLWPEKAEWFVIGGPADDHEAQGVVSKFPQMKCVGFEPNRELFEIQQKQRRFPGILHPCALWREDAELTLSMPIRLLQKRGSVCRPQASPDMPACSGKPAEEFYKVQGRSLDSLSDEFGPWNNVVLWLDIEYAELPALQGARRLLDRTLLVNLESFSHLDLPKIIPLLLEHGLMLFRMWNGGSRPGIDASDYVFVKVPK